MTAATSSTGQARLQLSKAQITILGQMITEAWATHVIHEQSADVTTKAKDEWRRKYLGTTVGIWSLKQIPRGGPIFKRVMGKLQEVARNGIDWIVKAGDATPAELVFHARAVLAEHDIPEAYACGLARNAFHFDRQPTLEEVGEEPVRLSNLIKIVYAQGPRISASAKRSEGKQVVGGVPF